jgi:myo-inositol-1(or 4)-monophosphatase
VKEIAVQAAEAGGKVLLEMFGKALQVRHKGAVDLVTDADQAAEKAIVDHIRGIFPRHDILAEEGDYGERSSAYRWIIDPLDGTTNYAHGLPWWSISIALEVHDQVALGLVYNPRLQELFFAEQGVGAFLNDLPIKVSAVESLDQALLATGFPYDRKTSNSNNYDHFINFQQAAQACRRPGVASLDLAYTACGRFDGYWEMKLKPWDLAAGQLIVAEAGGRVSNFSDGPLDIHGVEILASNGRIHQQMLAVLGRGTRP